MRALLAASILCAALTLACATTSGAGSGGGGDPQAAGQRLYREHCGSCHRLRDPAEQTRDRWESALRKFGDRAHLAPQDRPLVLAYLQAHAKDAAPAISTESP